MRQHDLTFIIFEDEGMKESITEFFARLNKCESFETKEGAKLEVTTSGRPRYSDELAGPPLEEDIFRRCQSHNVFEPRPQHCIADLRAEVSCV